MYAGEIKEKCLQSRHSWIAVEVEAGGSLGIDDKPAYPTPQIPGHWESVPKINKDGWCLRNGLKAALFSRLHVNVHS